MAVIIDIPDSVQDPKDGLGVEITEAPDSEQLKSGNSINIEIEEAPDSEDLKS